MNELVELIKRIAVNAVRAEVPTSILYGTVTSTDPLEIETDQKLKIPAEHLVRTQKVTDHDQEFEADVVGGEGGYVKTGKMKGGLKAGDKVLLVRHAGGQSYTVLDKLEG